MAGPMTVTLQLATTYGPVEITRTEGDGPTVLFFPGGHCRSSTDCGQNIYSALGYDVVSFSRPGYGRTRVGPMDAGAFADVVREVCDLLGVRSVAAAVGVSFGGVQAIRVAGHAAIPVERLVLHSSAPSTLSYPDTLAEALLGPVVFSLVLEGATWWLVRQLVRSDPGLRVMLAQLSTLPARQWWNRLSVVDKDQAREVFAGMRSGAGFTNDLRQARALYARSRRAALERVTCPALITASRHDGGVASAHAEDLHAHLESSQLVELPSPTHFFWIGPGSDLLTTTVREFLATS
jgi:pimeloyl-ACP methyl ester carboxylesterase